MSTQKILRERQNTHGSFEVNSQISQACKALIRSSPNYSEMNEKQKESLEMIVHKIGRILAGDPSFEDHWDDIAGYALLAKK